jgi:hypothetical protein
MSDEYSQEGSSGGQRVAAIMAILGLAGVGIMVFFIFSGRNLLNTFLGVNTDPTVAPPGDIRAFDPIKTFPEVKAYAGTDVQLTEMSATYVRSDGTLDLMTDLSPKPNVNYEFIHQVAAGKDAPPIGAGVGLDGMQWQTIDVDVGNPGTRTNVTRYSQDANIQYSYKNKGMLKSEGALQGSNYSTLLMDPTCSFGGLWAQAVSKGAPSNAVATIDYDDEGYTFRISDTDFELTFDNACEMTSFNGETVTAQGTPGTPLSATEATEAVKKELTRQNLPIATDGLPPRSYTAIRHQTNWYVIQQTEGSGLPGILSALCFRVSNNGNVTQIGTFTKNGSAATVSRLDPHTCTPV